MARRLDQRGRPVAVAEFSQITSDPTVLANLQKVFSSVDDVDLFIGGLAEDHAQGAMVGPTFQAIIAQQFENLCDGDRLWWQNAGFDQATMQQIQNTTLGDIETRNTDTTVTQSAVFNSAGRHPSNVPAEDPSQSRDQKAFPTCRWFDRK